MKKTVKPPRPSPLSLLERRAVILHAMGLGDPIPGLARRKEAQDLAKETRTSYEGVVPISKQALATELVARLLTAKDADAVRIAAQLSRMAGYDVPERQEIEIVWSEASEFDGDAGKDGA
jgi:hypothetical protein